MSPRASHESPTGPGRSGVRTRTGEDLVYTIARNRAHRSVEFIWPESVELEPEEDTLQVIPGIATSRPNLLLVTTEDNLDAFVAAWRSIGRDGGKNGEPFGDFVDKYGVRRTAPGFRKIFDSFNDDFRALDPIGGAALDLSRYIDG